MVYISLIFTSAPNVDEGACHSSFPDWSETNYDCICVLRNYMYKLSTVVYPPNNLTHVYGFPIGSGIPAIKVSIYILTVIVVSPLNNLQLWPPHRTHLIPMITQSQHLNSNCDLPTSLIWRNEITASGNMASSVWRTV